MMGGQMWERARLVAVPHLDADVSWLFEFCVASKCGPPPGVNFRAGLG